MSDRIIVTSVGQDYHVKSTNGVVDRRLAPGQMIDIEASADLRLTPYNWRGRLLLWLSRYFAPLPAVHAFTFTIEFQPKLEEWEAP